MGILGIFKKKNQPANTPEEKILQGAESQDILVPDHAKPKEVDESALEVKLVHSESETNLFNVNGIYDIGTDMMLSGVVESGKLKKKMKTKILEKDVVVTDVKVGSSSVTELLAHEEGTVFIRGKTMKNIKYGDVLEFK